MSDWCCSNCAKWGCAGDTSKLERICQFSFCKTKADNHACFAFTRGVHTMSLEEAIASGTVPPPHNFTHGVSTMSLEEAIASGTVPPPHNFARKL